MLMVVSLLLNEQMRNGCALERLRWEEKCAVHTFFELCVNKIFVTQELGMR